MMCPWTLVASSSSGPTLMAMLGVSMTVGEGMMSIEGTLALDSSRCGYAILLAGNALNLFFLEDMTCSDGFLTKASQRGEGLS